MTTDKLWTRHFRRICIANLLLFISLYSLFPALAPAEAKRLELPVAQIGVTYLFLTLGMFLIGPFHAYLVDAYKRKRVYIFSGAMMAAATVGYGMVDDFLQLLLLCLAQGVAFGMAATAGITLAIDMTGSALRSAGNVAFAWTGCLGMIIGAALGSELYAVYEFSTLLYVSVGTGVTGILFMAGVYVPFRAPIVTRLYSFDRFFLFRGWVPALNLILIAFVPGLLIPMVHSYLEEYLRWQTDVYLPFFVPVGVGFLLSLAIAKWSFLREKAFRRILSGTGLVLTTMILVTVSIPVWFYALILGVGLGLIAPEFLLLFVKLSHHCQRGTANTTHLLAWQTGIALGMATTCYFSMIEMSFAGRIAAVWAVIFFVLATFPYFRKKKVR